MPQDRIPKIYDYQCPKKATVKLSTKILHSTSSTAELLYFIHQVMNPDICLKPLIFSSSNNHRSKSKPQITAVRLCIHSLSKYIEKPIRLNLLARSKHSKGTLINIFFQNVSSNVNASPAEILTHTGILTRRGNISLS